ncbi:MAG: hypothetical protein JWO77_79 [Ilumatobacteraceae bacterium]|nr:hypothetical protein [Ilumatobacteraceae bacterium]
MSWASCAAVWWARRLDRSGIGLVVVIAGWLVSFAAAFVLIDSFPSGDRPLVFGSMWAFGGMVVTPAVAALAATGGSRRSTKHSAAKA